MACDMLCYPGGTDRFSYDGTGPGSGAAASTERLARVPRGFRSAEESATSSRSAS